MIDATGTLVLLGLKQKEKAAPDEAVKALAKPATESIVGKPFPNSHGFPETSTHFGGNLYFEEGETWPTFGDEKRPSDFVCQINLNDRP